MIGTWAYGFADVASALLCAYVALFFLQSDRLAPRRGLLLLAAGFGVYGAGFVAQAVDSGGVATHVALDAARAALLFAGSSLVFVYYAARRGAWGLATSTTLAVAGLVVALVYVLAYAVGGAQLAPPRATAPWLRLAGTILLILAALLVTMEVRAKTFLDFRVPLAFLCLAFAQYTTAVLLFHGGSFIDPWIYAWRVAGLLFLTSVVVSSGGLRLGQAA